MCNARCPASLHLHFGSSLRIKPFIIQPSYLLPSLKIQYNLLTDIFNKRSPEIHTVFLSLPAFPSKSPPELMLCLSSIYSLHCATGLWSPACLYARAVCCEVALGWLSSFPFPSNWAGHIFNIPHSESSVVLKMPRLHSVIYCTCLEHQAKPRSCMRSWVRKFTCHFYLKSLHLPVFWQLSTSALDSRSTEDPQTIDTILKIPSIKISKKYVSPLVSPMGLLDFPECN